MRDICVGVGRYHIDQKGTGRIYVPKALVKILDFENGEQVLIRVGENGFEVRKLEG
ncbi:MULTISPECIES: AbrB/MazE/SpoVT family DNA-binding domain-containing protein [unclassified Archaeoglobus]|jgi:antitoxin component of MazEF toxin-antitoxin module|uniref:AbrB/MazE/SpoVT family DNA-binding domain-containing protein n=1 Tax=unclassified Archaeoglobus TaxID=2643606 RepID=UPI0025C15FA0|nr:MULTISPECIES: hypothetical protein [unclassified Archaeoglobus]